MKGFKILLLSFIFYPCFFSQVSFETNTGYIFDLKPYESKGWDYFNIDRRVFSFELGLNFQRNYFIHKLAWNYTNELYNVTSIDNTFANTQNFYIRKFTRKSQLFKLNYALLGNPFRIKKIGFSPSFNLSISYLEDYRINSKSLMETDSTVNESNYNSENVHKFFALRIGYGMRLSYFKDETNEFFIDLINQRVLTDISYYESKNELNINLGYKLHFGKNIAELVHNENNMNENRKGIECQFNYGYAYLSKNYDDNKLFTLYQYDPNTNAYYTKQQIFFDKESSFNNFGVSVSMNSIKNRFVLNYGIDYNYNEINYHSSSTYGVKYISYPQLDYYNFNYHDTTDLRVLNQSIGLNGAVGIQLLDPSFSLNIVPTLSCLVSLQDYSYKSNEFHKVVDFHSYFPGQDEVYYNENSIKKATDNLVFQERKNLELFLGVNLTYLLNETYLFKLKYKNRISNRLVINDFSFFVKQKHNFSLSFVKFLN